MRPVTISATVAKPRQTVFEFLEAPVNHEAFMDHMLTDWRFSGPSRGVGARAKARANTIGSQDWTEFEITAAEPDRIVEDGVGNGGKRHIRGTYRLERLPDGGTEISLELSWVKASRLERFAPPLARAFTRRPYGKALRRLAKQLEQS